MRPAHVFLEIRWALAKVLNLEAASPCIAYVSTRVSHFLGSWNGQRIPIDCRRTFEVSAAAVRSYTGSRRGKRMRGATQQVPDDCPVLVLQHPRRLQGKIVLLEKPIRKIQPSSIAASLDCDPFFSLGSEEDSHAWHAAKVHHRWRLFAAPEAAVERVGSMMSNLWSNSQHLMPEALMGRVLMQQALISCTGHARDELLIAAVVDLYEKTRVKIWRESQPKELAQIQALHNRIGNSGRWSQSLYSGLSLPEAVSLVEPSILLEEANSRSKLRALRSSALAQSLPTTVPKTIEDCWQKATAHGTGPVQPLPVGVSVQRKSNGKAAPSTLQEKLSDWLASEDGKQWRTKRQELWANSASSSSSSGRV